MTPSQLLSELQTMGCQLRVVSINPPTLRLYDHEGKTSPDLRKAISDAKPEIINLMEAKLSANQPTGSAEPAPAAPVIGDSSLHNPVSSNDDLAKLYMLNAHGSLVADPKQCYLWTRGVFGFGWRYASEQTPPLL